MTRRMFRTSEDAAAFLLALPRMPEQEQKLDHKHLWKCLNCEQGGEIKCFSSEPEDGRSVTARIQIQHMRRSTWCKFDEDRIKVKRVRAA